MARLIDAIVSHENVWQGLLESRRAGRLPHALAFSGPPGIGKKQVAWAAAQLLVCDQADAPCGQCGPCLRVANKQSEAVLYIEPVNNNIKLEAATQILDFLSLQRVSRARVVIIDQAQLLNAQTANALLKSIEEPPPETFFILIVPEISQALPTLRSRVQNIRFAPLSEAQLAQLQTEAHPEWMLKSARGSLERLGEFNDEESNGLRPLALAFLQDASRGQRRTLDTVLGEVKERAVVLQFVRLMQQLLRDWTVLDSAPMVHVDLGESLRQLPAVDVERRAGLWRKAFQAETDLLANVDRSLILENFYYRASQALR